MNNVYNVFLYDIIDIIQAAISQNECSGNTTKTHSIDLKHNDVSLID